MPSVAVARCPSTRICTPGPAAADSSCCRWPAGLPGPAAAGAPPSTGGTTAEAAAMTRSGRVSEPLRLRRGGGGGGSSHLQGGLQTQRQAAGLGRWRRRRQRRRQEPRCCRGNARSCVTHVVHPESTPVSPRSRGGQEEHALFCWGHPRPRAAPLPLHHVGDQGRTAAALNDRGSLVVSYQRCLGGPALVRGPLTHARDAPRLRSLRNWRQTRCPHPMTAPPLGARALAQPPTCALQPLDSCLAQAGCRAAHEHDMQMTGSVINQATEAVSGANIAAASSASLPPRAAAR